MTHIVIVGGGLAAGTAAETLREEGYDGDVTVVTDEAHPPYQRPPLSKGYLAGRRSGCVILHPAEWYADHGIDLRRRPRCRRSTRRRAEVETPGADAPRYDSCCWRPAPHRAAADRRADLPGVHSLRGLDDSDALAEQAARRR